MKKSESEPGEANEPGITMTVPPGMEREVMKAIALILIRWSECECSEQNRPDHMTTISEQLDEPANDTGADGNSKRRKKS